MSEKPQHTESGTPEIDMLNEILDRAMPNIPDPPEEDTPDDRAEPGSAGTPLKEAPTAPPTPGKNKPSSVYVYLAVLFGAAFLMLLLAYFVQQRNNAAVQDDLELLTASRQELLDNIKTLEEENESLRQNNELLNLRLAQVKEEREALKERIDETYYSSSEQQMRVQANNLLNYLERFTNAGDWLMAGTLIEQYDPLFNEHNEHFTPGHLLPSQAARYLELREEVYDRGRCMIVERTYPTEDQSEYTERPFVQEEDFDEQDRNAATALMIVLSNYPTLPENSAVSLVFYFQPGSGNPERLNAGAFKPSTVELFQQVRADLIQEGFLEEGEDGSLSAPSELVFYGATSVILE